MDKHIIVLIVFCFFMSLSSVFAVSNDTFSESVNYENECVSLDSIAKSDSEVRSVSNVSILKESVSVNSVSSKVNTYFSSHDYVLNHKGTPFTIYLKDSSGNPLSGQSVTLNINGVPYSRTTKIDGSASLTINLNTGTYPISYSFSGTSTYAACTGSATISMVTYKLSSSLSGSNIVKYYDETASYNVYLKDNNGRPLVNENIVLTVNGVPYNRVINSEGLATLSINLPAGTYTISVSYAGNSYYYSSSTSNTIKVNKKATSLSGNDLTKYYGDTTPYSVQLKDYQGNVMSNRQISMTIHGETYTRTTNSNGYANLNINLPEGTYTVSSLFSGDSIYSNSNTMNNIIIIRKSTNIISDNLTKYYDEFGRFDVKLVDYLGNPLSDRILTFNVNGVNYTRTTGSDGCAGLDINLPAGVYRIATIHIGNEYYSDSVVYNTITVNRKATSLFGENLTKYYGDSTPYTVQLKDYQGHVLNNKIVTITINGITYTRNTSNDGHASLNINLGEGIYIATSVFSGDEAYNGSNVVNSVIIIRKSTNIISDNLTKYYGEFGRFNVKLVDYLGNPLSDRILTFNVNGVNYTRTTGNDGHASLDIDLPVGIYVITTTHIGNEYYDDYIVYNTIIVNRIPTFILGFNLTKYYCDSTPYTLRLMDFQENPLPYYNLTIKINNITYIKCTDNNGYVFLNIDLQPGTYNLSSSFSGNSYYSQSNYYNILIINSTLFEYTITLPNYLTVSNAWRLVPDGVINNYLLTAGAGAILKIPISRYLNVYTYNEDYSWGIYSNGHNYNYNGIKNEINSENFMNHVEIPYENNDFSKIIINYNFNCTNITFRGWGKDISRFSAVYKHEQREGMYIKDFEEVDFIIDGEIKAAIAFSNPIDFDDFGLRYALSGQNVASYPQFNSCPYNKLNNYEFVFYTATNEYLQYDNDLMRIASFPLVETINTNFKHDNYSLNKNEKISFGTGGYDFENGFETLQTFTITNRFVLDNDINYFLNFDNDYFNPVLTASYGTFLLGISTTWLYDSFACNLSDSYNLTINRDKSAVILSGIEYGGLSYIHCLNPEMGLSKEGDEENIFLFNFMTSLMLSLSERISLNLCGHNISASFETLFSHIINFENFTVIKKDNYSYFMLTNNSQYIFKIDMETGLVWDLFNINNFTYKGALANNSYCLHSDLTLLTHNNLNNLYHGNFNRTSNEDIEFWSKWLSNVIGDIALSGSAKMTTLAIVTLFAVGSLTFASPAIIVALALGSVGVFCKYYGCLGSDENFLEESTISFVTSLT